jgi:aldose 1-epimerase
MRFSGVLPLLPALLAAAPAHAQSGSSISVSVFGALSSAAATATGSVASSAASTASSTSSAAPQQTPGFVNNGTVGMYPCAGGNPDSVNTPLSNRTDAAMPADSSSTAAASSSDASSALGQMTLNSTSSTSRLYALGIDYGSCPEAQAPAYPTQPIHLRAPDDSVRATFSPYGAGVTELWVKDRSGTFRDVVLGFDNITNYLTDPLHPNFGPIVGRYANRIQNGTYEIDGTTYHAPLNENNVSTLHGGTVGYDRSPFEIVSLNASAVTFALTDPDGNQGFPGTVRSHVSYALRAGGVWSIAMNATVTEKKSPIMLSSHAYWNLDGYKREDNETTILDHVLHLPQADKYIEVSRRCPAFARAFG